MRKLALLVPLPFLVALAAFCSARLADRGGATLGAALAAVATVVGAPQQPAFDEDAELDATVPVSLFVPAPAVGTSEAAFIAGAKRGKARAVTTSPAPVRAIFVSASTVLRLSESRVTPKGIRVPADGARPAGLKLVGVEGLGIGLRDGDVLTRALGQPALSSSAIVRAILVARANRVRVLEGEFYRGSERWSLRVEQPYLDEAPRP